MPKAIAAADKLRKINSEIKINPVVQDLNHNNIEQFLDVDLILDGSDNFEIRFLVNDASISSNIPWVYGGCLGAFRAIDVDPARAFRLSALLDAGRPPPPGSSPTCDTAGIIAPIIGVIASIQCSDALKILVGDTEQLVNSLTVVDLWEKTTRQLDLKSLYESRDCPCCRGRNFEWLEGKKGSQTAVLCGRNSVQLLPDPGILFRFPIWSPSCPRSAQ